MRYPGGSELPDEKQDDLKRALLLERISVAYWISAIIVLYFTLGQSQAMKAAWVEDILSLFPPIAFLVAARFRDKKPTARFPWGYHRAMSLAYLVASVALFGLGLFILVDSVERLLAGAHPPIGMVELFDWQVWLGWLMLAALAYSAIPSMILGRLKRPLADSLHEKVLFADAKMNQADWLTAAAAMGGVIGIGFGLWYADAVAAIVISLDILWEGQRFIRESASDLMDKAAKTHDESKPHPLIDQIRQQVISTTWVAEAAVRVREQGHLLATEIWLVPTDSAQLDAKVEELTRALQDLDWRIQDVIISPVRSIENAPEGVGVSSAIRTASESPAPSHTATSPR